MASWDDFSDAGTATATAPRPAAAQPNFDNFKDTGPAQDDFSGFKDAPAAHPSLAAAESADPNATNRMVPVPPKTLTPQEESQVAGSVPGGNSTIQNISGGIGRGAANLAIKATGIVAPQTAAKMQENVNQAYPIAPGVASTVGQVVGGSISALPLIAAPEAAIPLMAGQGAVEGVGGARTEVAQERAAGQNVSGSSEAARAAGYGLVGAGAGAAGGAVLGAAGGIANPLARIGANAIGGAALGAGQTAAENAIAGRPVGQGVEGAAITGGATQGIFAGAHALGEAFTPPEAASKPGEAASTAGQPAAKPTGYIAPADIPDNAKFSGTATINGTPHELVEMPDGSVRVTDAMRGTASPEAQQTEWQATSPAQQDQPQVIPPPAASQRVQPEAPAAPTVPSTPPSAASGAASGQSAGTYSAQAETPSTASESLQQKSSAEIRSAVPTPPRQAESSAAQGTSTLSESRPAATSVSSPAELEANRSSPDSTSPAGAGQGESVGGANQSLSAAGATDPYMDAATGKTSLQNLTDQISKVTSTDKPLAQQMRDGATLGEKMQGKVSGVVDTVTAARDRLAGGMAALVNAYKEPASDATYPQAVRQWSGADNISALETNRYTATAKTQIPDKLTREAIYAHVEAGGDVAKLKEQAVDLASDPATRKYARIYEAAANLSDEHKMVVNATAVRNDATLAEMQKAGMLKDGVDNYMTHIWDRDPDAMRQVIGQSNLQSLTTNPTILKERTLADVYTGLKAGFTPKTMDFADTTAIHERAMRQAMAARAFIKTLYEGKADDGRPLSTISMASAKELPATDEKPNAAFLVKPNMKPSDNFADYRTVDHPALRGWKVATVDENGRPTIVQGDMLVHPDAYQSLKNNLSKSAIRSYEMNIGGMKIKPGAAILNASAETKNIILSLSGFHQATLGLRASEASTVPAFMPEIDTSEGSLDRKLIMHGMNVAQFNAAEQFGEGVASTGGLIQKIPLIGPAYHAYTDYLFNDYMPRLKAAFARNAYDRNTARYGKTLSDDQIASMTADQANARFGGLNYRVLGRNKTFQDVLRLGLMAPDFLESTARTVGQAAKPFGREQSRAIALGAVGMYTAGALLNTMISGNPHLDKPFTVVVGGKEYGLRSIAGDLVNLVENPLSFAENRLSPAASFVMHMLTRTNQFNEPSKTGKIAVNALKSEVPIPAQPWTSGSRDAQSQKIFQMILKMGGVQVKSEPRSETESPAVAKLGELARANGRWVPSEAQRAQTEKKYSVIDKIRDNPSQSAQLIGDAIKRGDIKDADQKEIQKVAGFSDIQSAIYRAKPEDVVAAWPLMNAQEKSQSKEMILEKISKSRRLSDDEKDALSKQVK